MNALDLTALACVSPGVIERARRVQFAAEMLKSGKPESEVRARVKAHFGLNKVTAWRTVEVARDVV